MTAGAGRFATPSQFEVVQEFFDSTNIIPQGSHSFSAILSHLGITGANPNRASINQSEYAFGGDFLERVFVYNNSSFEIDLSVNPMFVVDSNGDRYIEDLRILPVTDNWDFISNDPQTILLNGAIYGFIDPSDALTTGAGQLGDGLGRKVDIEFTGSAPLDVTYTEPEYQSDVGFIASQEGPAFQAAALLAIPMQGALNELWADGYTNFIDYDDRALLHGTDGDDIIYATDIPNIYNQSAIANWFGPWFISNLEHYNQNGTHIISGDGNDTIIGDQWNDVLDAGKGDDFINGLGGFDLVDYKRFDYVASDSDIASVNITVVDRAAGDFDVEITYTDSSVESDDINGIERIAHAEHEVNTNTNGTHRDSAIAGLKTSTSLADGGYVVVWESQNQGGLSYQIRAQRNDEDGNPVATGGAQEFAISTGTTHAQYDPQVTTLANGGFVVAWQSKNASNKVKAFARIFDADGTPSTSDIEVFKDPDPSDPEYTDFRSQEYSKDIAVGTDGKMLVVAAGSGDQANSTDIYGQIMTASGGVNPKDKFIASDNGAGVQTDPAVAALSGGGYVVSYTNTHSSGDGSYNSVFYRKFAADGTASGASVLVNETTLYNQNDSDVTGLEDGGFVVTWRGYDGKGDGVWFKKYDASGSVEVSEMRVNENDFGGQTEPQVIALEDGGFLISFTEGNSSQDGSSSSVWAQQYDKYGSKVQGTFLVNVTTTLAQKQSDVAALEDGDFAVSWSHSAEVHTRIYNNSAEIPTAPPAAPLMGGGGSGSSSLVGGPQLAEATAFFESEALYAVKDLLPSGPPPSEDYFKEYRNDGFTNIFGFSNREYDAGLVKIIDTYSVDEGDMLNFYDILERPDGIDKAIEDYFQVAEANGNTVVSIDKDGAGERYDFQDVVQLQATPNIDIAALIESGNILV